MASTTPQTSKFITAMQHIYRFPTEPTSEPWTPPPMTSGHKGRYLWTDAFGVLNLITLHRTTTSPHYLTYAQTLVSTVHSILAYTRSGTSRLPGASATHPLAGGLRIGKDDERGPDGDGQYHHYLTLWMFALNRLSLACNNKSYNDQAIELAKAIHPRFVYDRDKPRPRMVWKMSMDLGRPLVSSEGNLDPVDGFVVFRLLQQTDGEGSRVLAEEIEDYEKIVRTKWQGYSSQDPLDLGMTLWTAHWFKGEEWADGLVSRATRDLEELWDEGYFKTSMRRRLAFREFGTGLGMLCGIGGGEWGGRAREIAEMWEKTGVVPRPERGSKEAGYNASDDLLPITLVMYAAALNPGAFQKEFL